MISEVKDFYGRWSMDMLLSCLSFLVFCISFTSSVVFLLECGMGVSPKKGCGADTAGWVGWFGKGLRI